jgi:hypothetical protein
MVIVEPSAESLALAHDTFDQFAAFLRAGFDAEQSIHLTGIYLSNMIQFSSFSDWEEE